MSKALKTKILLLALPDVPFDGWTDSLLERAAERARVESTAAFPKGIKELVEYFSIWANDETLAKLKKSKLETMRVRDKITLGVRTRLEILQPHKQAVSAALAFMALPPRNLAMPKLVWTTADMLWRAAGDTATDYNYYTKRLLLSGVLTSTTLYWLNDTSKNHASTWQFLDRRIGDVLKIGQKISGFKPKQENK
jgi:ubiquinone biosynthesis protein COQ9